MAESSLSPMTGLVMGIDEISHPQLRAYECGGCCDAFVEVDLRLEAEQLVRLGDRRHAQLDVDVVLALTNDDFDAEHDRTTVFASP